MVINSFANYTEFSGEKKHLLSPWKYILWYGKNRELKLSDKGSNNVNPKHRNSTLKSKPCSNKQKTFSHSEMSFISFFPDLKVTGSDTLMQKQLVYFFRCTPKLISNKQLSESAANMRKEFKLLNTTVVWGTCHRHGSNAKAHHSICK